MTTDKHGAAHDASELPTNPDVTFERSDVEVGSIYWYLFALGVAVALSLFVCVYIFRFTANLTQESNTPPTAAMQQMSETMSQQKKDPATMQYPDEPRLQGVPGHPNDPQEDLRQKIEADKKANESLAWIDRNAGLVQIPVEDAMKIIAEKGLAGAVPAEKKP
jgi:hypothetical protein